jgi:hypothetical protein
LALPAPEPARLPPPAFVTPAPPARALPAAAAAAQTTAGPAAGATLASGRRQEVGGLPEAVLERLGAYALAAGHNDPDRPLPLEDARLFGEEEEDDDDAAGPASR